jgi:hypothetical protein
LRNEIKGDWDALYLMRHHGVPTRLLDWSDNLFTAIFFAIQDIPNEVNEPCIWVLNPYRLNENEKVTSGFLINPELDEIPYFKDFCYDEMKCKWQKPIAIYPYRANKRIYSQSGCFTVHGKNKNGIEELCPTCVKKFIIPSNLIDYLRDLLKYSGINRYSVYNDLDNLATYLKEEKHIN